MEGFLGRYSSYIYAIFRIVFGFVFMMYGTQKFFGWPPSQQPGAPLAGIMLVAAIIELVCGFLIIIGFFGSIAAFIASGEMAVAYFMVHQAMGILPPGNNGQAAVLFCFAFLYIASKGSGLWSVDSLMKGSRTADTA
ncbi:MAG: DoxX family protein [Acidobacteria bacterium]|nr:DoxX family protein [Acidobacteriota bacterium]